jgi:hypothetical protein
VPESAQPDFDLTLKETEISNPWESTPGFITKLPLKIPGPGPKALLPSSTTIGMSGNSVSALGSESTPVRGVELLRGVAPL